MNRNIKLGKITFSNNRPFVLIAGPCVIENRTVAFTTAKALKEITDELEIPFVFKASYDKANRTSIKSFRGLGKKRGLAVLREIKEKLKLPVLSDAHSVAEVKEAAQVLDIIQIPAFLCRQTDLLCAAAKTGKVVNIKKGQFLAPWDIGEAIKKVTSKGNHKILLTERGVSFGYNNLVSDFRSIAIMKKTGYPVVFDASHSVQQPGGLGQASGGKSEFIPLLARCAISVGVSALFMEIHPSPKKARSDGPNMLALKDAKKLLKNLKMLDEVIKNKLLA